MSDFIGRLFLWGATYGSIVAGDRLYVVCRELRHQWGATPLLRVRRRR